VEANAHTKRTFCAVGWRADLHLACRVGDLAQQQVLLVCMLQCLPWSVFLR